MGLRGSRRIPGGAPLFIFLLNVDLRPAVLLAERLVGVHCGDSHRHGRPQQAKGSGGRDHHHQANENKDAAPYNPKNTLGLPRAALSSFPVRSAAAENLLPLDSVLLLGHQTGFPQGVQLSQTVPERFHTARLFWSLFFIHTSSSLSYLKYSAVMIPDWIQFPALLWPGFPHFPRELWILPPPARPEPGRSPGPPPP